MLCTHHGWNLDSPEVELNALTLWTDEDLLELHRFLEKAVPEPEKAIRL